MVHHSDRRSEREAELSKQIELRCSEDPSMEDMYRDLHARELSFRREASRLVDSLKADSRLAGVHELTDELADERMERFLTLFTNYFESCIPDHLLGAESIELTVDPNIDTALWTDGEEIELLEAVSESLSFAEYSEDAVGQMQALILEAFADGSMKPPGFSFVSKTGSQSIWLWEQADQG